MTDPTAGVPLTRAVELEIEIDASPDAVWKAISEGDELVRWFPMEAKVDPGVGGRVWVSWGEGMAWSSRIAVWEPNRRLKSVDEPPEGAPPFPVEVAVEYEIQAREGRTVLRLVHSGFSAEADWDQFYDATVAGWTYFLRNLKHYLERHRGVPRKLIRWRRPMTVAAAEVWRMLADPTGLGFAGVKAGSRWTHELLPGVPPGGEVWMVRPPFNYACTIEGLNDAVLFIEMEPGGETWHCGIWLSTYGLPANDAAALEKTVTDRIDRILAPGVAA